MEWEKLANCSSQAFIKAMAYVNFRHCAVGFHDLDHCTGISSAMGNLELYPSDCVLPDADRPPESLALISILREDLFYE